jgi:hypothetical protein
LVPKDYIFVLDDMDAILANGVQRPPENLWNQEAFRSIASQFASDVIPMASRAFTWMGCKGNFPFSVRP